MDMILVLLILLLVGAACPYASSFSGTGTEAANGFQIIAQDRRDFFAAQELQRYMYRAGLSLPIIRSKSSSLEGTDLNDRIILARVSSTFGKSALAAFGCDSDLINVSEEGSHLVHSLPGRSNAVAVVGASTLGVLYGAYSFLETSLGVVFQIGDDLVPETPTPMNLVLSSYNCRVFKPVFSVRGLLPFHDFPSGPDWWSEDDFKVLLEGLTRMKQNFIGLHTYPWQRKNAEPTVWVGTEASLNPDGSIKPELPGAYSSGWTWSSKIQKGYTYVESTSSLPFGIHTLFHHNCFSSPIQQEFCPRPRTVKQATVFFDRAHSFLRSILSYGRQSGIKSCFGVEVPLTKPNYSSVSMPSSEDYFKGVFRRIMSVKGYELDYFWLWTSESWIGNVRSNSTLYKEALADFRAASRAKVAVGAPWKLATGGWVVGPLPDRSVMDRVLPRGFDVISSLDGNVGNSPVDPAYAKIKGHQKWVIPWLEDDRGLTEPQLWVNRTLEHMDDALKYGSHGLVGIHWRTSVVAPTMTAMAAKSWNSSLQSLSFWTKWCKASFGESAGRILVSVFVKIDGKGLPRPATWLDGPGAIVPSKKQCLLVDKSCSILRDYHAVAAFEMTGYQRQRYSYWSNVFHFMLSTSKFSCAWAEAEDQIEVVLKHPPQEVEATLTKASAIASFAAKRDEMVANATQMMDRLLATVNSKSDFGVAFSLLSHSLLQAFSSQEQRLQLYALPKLKQVPHNFPTGKCRLIVPTRRSVSTRNEPYVLEAIFLASRCQVDRFELHWFRLGSTDSPYVVDFVQMGETGCVFQASIEPDSSFEWYAIAASDQCPGGDVRFPADAPKSTQTVVLKDEAVELWDNVLEVAA